MAFGTGPSSGPAHRLDIHVNRNALRAITAAQDESESLAA
jgi:hypothetical protein